MSGTRASLTSIPMAMPDVGEDEIAAVLSVLRTPVLSMGPWTTRFEERVAGVAGAPHAAAVSSGTTGLHLCVIAAGVHDGDLVVTTPFSFVASANVILYERAIPIFVDIEPRGLNIDSTAVAEAVADLREGGIAASRWLPPRLRSDTGAIKAILPVHAFGQPADMDSIAETASRHRVSVIEDACEAIGAEYKGRPAGNLGDAGVFAFYPNKQMTTGEGGMIVTRREDWHTQFLSTRNQGRDLFNAWLRHDRLGFNYRMDELSAALGAVQIERLDELLARRQETADRYGRALRSVDGVAAPVVLDTTTRMSWFVYVVRLDERIDRDAVVEFLDARGVPSRPYFSPIHLQPFYRERFGFDEGMYPETEKAGRSCLALPFFGGMTEEQVEVVCGALRAAIRAQS